MKTLVVAFLLSFFCSLAATPLARRLAARLRALDTGDGKRKVHAGTIPRLGGLAIVFGFFVPITGLLFYDNTIAEAFLRGGVANFVGTYWPVLDVSGEQFARAFYLAAVDGEPLGAAVLKGRKAVTSSDWADYMFYGSPSFCLKHRSARDES